MSKRFAVCLALIAAAFVPALASNPQDEQTVRIAYAKLAYAVQAKTVFDAVTRDPQLNSLDLNKRLQEDDVRFHIVELTSGSLSDIASRPYSDFATRPDGQPVLQITDDTENFDENGKRVTSHLAMSQWSPSSTSIEDSSWDAPVAKALEMAGVAGKFSRYVAATITVQFKGQSRSYHAFWLFGSEILSVDLVTGGNVPCDFVTQNVYPSVLTDTSLRSRVVVEEWLNSTQRFEASCKTGKQDVCCDLDSLRCGIAADDLRSTKPAPTTTAVPKSRP